MRRAAHDRVWVCVFVLYRCNYRVWLLSLDRNKIWLGLGVVCWDFFYLQANFETDFLQKTDWLQIKRHKFPKKCNKMPSTQGLTVKESYKKKHVRAVFMLEWSQQYDYLVCLHLFLFDGDYFTTFDSKNTFEREHVPLYSLETNKSWLFFQSMLCELNLCLNRKE